MEMKPIKFTNLLVNPTPYEYNLLPFTPRKSGQTQFENEEQTNVTIISPKKKIKIQPKIEKDTTLYIPFEYVNWEDDICKHERQDQENKLSLDLPLNFLLDDIFSEKWETRIDNPMNAITLLYNDPNLIFTSIEKKKKKNRKYNLSNDKYYAIKKQKKSETLNILGIQHSIIALQLHDFFYKTNLIKETIRNWHRNYIKNFTSVFDKTKEMRFTNTRIKKSSSIKNISDLSLTDNANFCLIEYCEEFPLLVNNGGMVSLICEYERVGKPLEEEKNSIKSPQPLFNKIILQEGDPSPLPIGNVKSGRSVFSISNNLFKTSLYKQKSDNLFLVVYNESNPENSVVRPINYLLATGQILPSEEVFSPHSKTLNSFCKNRLKMCAVKFVESKKEKDKDFLIKMKDLDEMFPTFSEGLKRKWLKEFAEKRKDNSYVLNLRGYVKDEELITPENVCQYESMLVGERLIKDLILENELSPWNLSRNFLKGTYEVQGKGDPLNGNGISFFRGIIEKDLLDKRWETMERTLKNKFKFSDLKQKEIRELKNLTKGAKEKETKKDMKKNIEFKHGIKITRTIKGKVEEEIVTDEDIIKMYLKERKKIKKEDKKPTMKCSRCGEIGHMKTNKMCSFYEGVKMNKKSREQEFRKKRNFISETINTCLNFCFSIPFSAVFHRPVNHKKFPNYINFVKNPIDLSIMRMKARQHKYKTFSEFLDDLGLMYDNCVAYNGKEHSFSLIACQMIDNAKEEFRNNSEMLLEAERAVLDEIEQGNKTIMQ